MSRRIGLAGIVSLFLGLLSGPAGAEGPTQAAPGPLMRDETAALAAEAYVYGYPLVLMDFSRQVMTATAKPDRERAPANQFNVSEQFPDPSFTNVVSPNADTLYSIAWLDLAKGPIVLNLPDVGDRFYLMQMLDAWTNVFASPGTRTTGNRKGSYAITGPGWKGALPEGVKRIDSPTDMVWILGRTQTNGKKDYEAVRAIKSQYRLIPLSAWGTDYKAPAEVAVNPKIDGRTAPVEQAEKLDAASFLGRLALLMKNNPPTEADKPMLAKLARIGVVPGQVFDAKALGAESFKGIEAGVREAKASLTAEGKNLDRVPRMNGWTILLDVGRYGIDYRQRAIVALVGLGANLPEDAIYPMTSSDDKGKPLSGAHQYTLRFAKGELPPARAFWSLTMYNARRFFAANSIDRYAIGDRDKLQFGEDGSLTLYLQHDSPGKDRESNWLPAPEGDFALILRIYWPKTSVLDGSWKPPVVTKVK